MCVVCREEPSGDYREAGLMWLGEGSVSCPTRMQVAGADPHLCHPHLRAPVGDDHKADALKLTVTCFGTKQRLFGCRKIRA